METLIKWLKLAVDNPKLALLILLIFIVCIGFGAYFTSCMSERGRHHGAHIAPEVILVDNGIHHIGDEVRPEYPAENEGRILQKTFGFQLKAEPSRAILQIEGYDVDLYGARVFVNRQSIGKLRTGDPWQETQLTIPLEVLSIGPNRITIKSEEPSSGKIEDCLFRNIRVSVEY